MHFSTSALLALIPSVLGHGLIQTPPSRPVGDAIVANCGNGVTTQIKQDNTSHVEGLPEAAAKDKNYNAAKCNLWLCKGLQFTDNPTANIQTWKAGDVIPIKVWVRIPHEGSANVSIVDTKTNTLVGTALKAWAKGYAPGKSESDVPADQKQFSVTIPTGLETKCANAGDCVLQWWWYGTGAKQTYESCVDFKIAAPNVTERAFKA
ncbi:hypothetical protein BDV96DRAFT_106420 [Lophiotrema nucula]|uniref:Chitin-binding type-4 domain-containing protein n=1 Tax=Lophiotrema nucula TaxID=690887 RepID=A0A6A5Z3L8_9PLEO|nr:hypothetical protein BDV96DRAFT_106420 [Lophiotrema nucula]